MRLERIEQAIVTCQNHLSKNPAIEPEIEAFLTEYLLILICAEFEAEVKKIIVKRSSLANDPILTKFVDSFSQGLVRSIQISELEGLLNKFGAEYKKKFQERLNDKEENKTRFSSIIANRHKVAHKAGTKSQMTLPELIESYNKGNIVLDILSQVILESMSFKNA
ncbi:MAG: hypothetical protein HZA78_11115 [Candidatus Schekmanbacteria bacterium]|nr:hypothetical protein [Candidatus Schekmanbacteria bacterium]